MPAAALEKIRTAVGPDGWLEQPADIDPYLSDFRGLFHGRAPLVVLPASTQEVSALLRICS
ncbi:MAG: hydroxyacid dehydrogenase, partial [Vitreimonas sp.]